MNKSIVSIGGSNRIILTGWLNIITVNEVGQQIERIMQQLQSPISIDLQQLTQVDSAALALLIHCFRLAKRQHKSIHFENIPDNLLSIATISGLNGLLFNEGIS